MKQSPTRRELLDSLEHCGYPLTPDREHAILTSTWCRDGHHRRCRWPAGSLFACPCACHRAGEEGEPWYAELARTRHELT